MSRKDAIKKLKNLRKTRGVTVWGLAKSLGVRFQDLYYIESGKRKPTLKVAVLLEEKCGIPCGAWLN